MIEVFGGREQEDQGNEVWQYFQKATLMHCLVEKLDSTPFFSDVSFD